MEKKTLWQKILEVKKAIDWFTKDSKWYKYSFVSWTQVLHKIKDAMIENWLLLIPQVIHNWEVQQIWSNYLITCNMKYIWKDVISNEELIVPWTMYWLQNDPSKAFWSWLTYSERYFLLKFFNVPTDEDDPDTNQKTKQVKKEKPFFNQKELDWMMKKKDTIKTYNNAIELINKHYKIWKEMKEKVRNLFIDEKKIDKNIKKAQEQLWKVQETMK